MFIAEVFHSIQGEGRLAGTPSVFIRTSGCNLRCRWCDTPYASWNPEGEERDIAGLVDQVSGWECDHVVITGGEPMLVPDVVPLSQSLAQRGKHITIETAGTVDLGVTADLMSISPKLSNSTPHGADWEARHEARRDRPDVIRRFIADYDYQLKFVIETPTDIKEVARYLEQFPMIACDRIMLMPQATAADELESRNAWLHDEAHRHGWTVSPRLHIELFGNTRGT